MITRPATMLIENYDAIALQAKQTKEPIYITNQDGEIELVVMDIKAYEEREEQLKLTEMLLATELNRLRGAKTFTASEVEEKIKGL